MELMEKHSWKMAFFFLNFYKKVHHAPKLLCSKEILLKRTTIGVAKLVRGKEEKMGKKWRKKKRNFSPGYRLKQRFKAYEHDAQPAKPLHSSPSTSTGMVYQTGIVFFLFWITISSTKNKCKQTSSLFLTNTSVLGKKKKFIFDFVFYSFGEKSAK